MSSTKKEEPKIKKEIANIEEMRVIFQSLQLNVATHQLIEQVLQHFENKE